MGLCSGSTLMATPSRIRRVVRAMAEDVLDKCFDKKLLRRVAGGVTAHLPLVGAGSGSHPPMSAPPGLHLYGSEAAQVAALPGHRRELGGGLTESMVRFAARYEYARTVEDVLARRSRLLFLDARMAGTLAAEVGAILLQETGVDPQAQAFRELAVKYLQLPV